MSLWSSTDVWQVADLTPNPGAVLVENATGRLIFVAPERSRDGSGDVVRIVADWYFERHLPLGDFRVLQDGNTTWKEVEDLMLARTHFISGHLDLTEEEFNEYYVPRILTAIQSGARFVVGDAPGADHLAQRWLKRHGTNVTVFHMGENPRYSNGLPTRGGFKSDTARDSTMTAASSHDIAWVREGRENSGTARNLERRGVR